MVAAVMLAVACVTTEAVKPEAATPNPAPPDTKIDIGDLIIVSHMPPELSLMERLRAHIEEVRIVHEGLLKPAIPPDPDILAGEKGAGKPKHSVPSSGPKER